MRSTKPRQDITAERFSTFLAWLNPDRERAGEEYELLRFKLLAFFRHRRCCYADELADETINRVILRSAEESIEKKLEYFYGVARNVYREFVRKQRVEVGIEDLTLPSTVPDEPNFSHDCLDKCLEKLSPDSKDLVLNYFSQDKSAKVLLHQQISRTLKTTQTALRMRVYRIKENLKNCIHDCMSESHVTKSNKKTHQVSGNE